MSFLREIRWHSRAGQGAITAANALAEIAVQVDLYAQSFPEFGAEKRGAPVKVFNRLSDKEILISTEIEEPNFVILLDTTLVNHEISYADVLEGLKPNGTLLINTEQKKTKFNELFQGKIYHLAASQIAEKYLQRDLPNIPTLAGLLKIIGLIDYDKAAEAVQGILAKKLPAPVVEANLLAFKEGYETVLQPARS